MITNERKKEIIQLLDDVDHLVQYRKEMSIQDVLFMFEYCKSTTTVNGDPPHRSMFLLAENVKTHVGWYSLRNKFANTVTFIQDGNAYLFTDRQKAEATAKDFTARGYDVIIHDAEPALAEDTVFTALRCGAKELVINKDSDDAAIVPTRFIWPFADAMNRWSNDEARLSRAVAEHSTEINSKYKHNYDAAFIDFIRQMELIGVYYIATEEKPDIPMMKPVTEDEKTFAYCVFTQMDELRRIFPHSRAVIKKEPFSAIYQRLGGTYVINYSSFAIVFNHTAAQWSVDFRTDYNDVYAEVKKCLGDVPDVKKTTDLIMSVDDIYAEFLNGITPDGFEYPQENPVTVANYTAQVLQRIVAKNHAEAYSKLARMRIYPNSVQKVVSGG